VLTRLRAAQPLDVLLFRCRMPHSVAQRMLTQSEWDHVAIVVREPAASHRLRLLECVSAGVICMPLDVRLRQYGADYADYFVWRPLDCQRTALRLGQMDEFVRRAHRRPFTKDVLRLATARWGGGGASRRTGRRESTDSARAKDDAHSAKGTLRARLRRHSTGSISSDATSAAPTESLVVEPAASPTAATTPDKSYFCSQLVAHVWQALGVLPPSLDPAAIWPGHLATGGKCERLLEPGVTLGAEALIDWRPPEAADAFTRAHADPPASAAV
jgi:hypothetical protein